MRPINTALASLATVLIVIGVLSLGIVRIQGQPLATYLRFAAVALLGYPSPGITAPADAPQQMHCNTDTGECEYH